MAGKNLHKEESTMFVYPIETTWQPYDLVGELDLLP